MTFPNAHVQFNGGANQWVKGKSPETFAPIGPWLVTKEEIADPHDLQDLARS